MGKHMAGHLQTKGCSGNASPVVVWNRTPSRAAEHSMEYGTEQAQDISDLSKCSIIFLSLPTSQEVKQMLAQIALKRDTIVVGQHLSTCSTSVSLLHEHSVSSNMVQF